MARVLTPSLFVAILALSFGAARWRFSVRRSMEKSWSWKSLQRAASMTWRCQRCQWLSDWSLDVIRGISENMVPQCPSNHILVNDIPYHMPFKNQPFRWWYIFWSMPDFLLGNLEFLRKTPSFSTYPPVISYLARWKILHGQLCDFSAGDDIEGFTFTLQHLEEKIASLASPDEAQAYPLCQRLMKDGTALEDTQEKRVSLGSEMENPRTKSMVWSFDIWFWWFYVAFITKASVS